MHPLIEQLRLYAAQQSLSRQELAARLGIPYGTVKSWLGPRPRAKLSRVHEQRVQALLGGTIPLLSAPAGAEKQAPAAGEARGKAGLRAEAKRRVHRLRMLLLLLEDELRWFRDGQADRRAAYRAELDPYDIGYVSSLLSMLTDEEKFQRWRLLTTNRFRSFRRRAKAAGSGQAKIATPAPAGSQ